MTIQTHYLPQKAYLSFFECADPKGAIWMYRRGKSPVCLSIEKAGREGNLYCFTDQDGNFNSDIEALFEKVESAAYPILSRTNKADEDFELTDVEWARISEFMAIQLVRTPGWFNKVKGMTAAMAKAIMMKIAADDKMWQAANRKTPTKFPNLNLKKHREYVLSGGYDLEATGSYFLGLAIQMIPTITAIIYRRNPIVLRSSASPFFTSDHPVAMVRHPKSPPMWATGLINSDLIFPIGSSAALDLRVFNRDESEERPRVTVKVRDARATRLKYVNRLTTENAERFLFANLESRTIARVFAATEKPERFTVDTHPRIPFVRVQSHRA